MNENFDKQYRIEPMLEIIDEYLNDIYREHFWGYSLPLYLSAANGCHPNYAIYFASKGTLTVKSYNEILKSIPKEDKALYNKDKAEKIYKEYQENYVDDRESVEQLVKVFIHIFCKKLQIKVSGSTSHTKYTRIQNNIPVQMHLRKG